jgi:hypothetical protein
VLCRIRCPRPDAQHRREDEEPRGHDHSPVNDRSVVKIGDADRQGSELVCADEDARGQDQQQPCHRLGQPAGPR